MTNKEIHEWALKRLDWQEKRLIRYFDDKEHAWHIQGEISALRALLKVMEGEE